MIYAFPTFSETVDEALKRLADGVDPATTV
jgi:hypothetical protein